MEDEATTNPNREELGNNGFADLPLQLVAKCVSFNVQTPMDVAKLRLVSRSFGRLLSGILPSIGEERGHHLTCPPKEIGEKAFVQQVELYDEVYESFRISIGDQTTATFDESMCSAFLGHTFIGFTVLDRPCDLQTYKENNTNDESKAKEIDGEVEAKAAPELDEKSKLAKIKEVVLALQTFRDVETLGDIVMEIKVNGLFEPNKKADPPISSEKLQEEDDDDIYVYPVVLKISLPKDATCIAGKTSLDDGTQFLHLKNVDEFDNEVFNVMDFGCEYVGMVTKYSETDGYEEVHVLCRLFAHCDLLCDVDMDVETSLSMDKIWSKCQEQGIVEGVVVADDVIGKGLKQKLIKDIDGLASRQEDLNMKDYHPGSNDIVRDIVHPGLYSYVKDISPLRAKPEEVDPCIFPSSSALPEQTETSDFWGRKYETSVYQWLPTYFEVAKDGTCKICDYINNLAPRDDPVHTPLYDDLERLFEICVPYIEAVYGYVRTIRPFLRKEGDGVDYNPDALKEVEPSAYTSFRGQKLQVITKIVDYELKPGQSHEGVWHVEGMSHEEIICTCLYILDRDDDIKGGELMFQRAFHRDEANYIFSNVPQDRHPTVNSMVNVGLAPMGRVETRKGRLIVFPNSHVHKVETLLHEGEGEGQDKNEAAKRRRIVVFFLVNPMRRIVSTREVAPQQESAGGGMSHEDALSHRLKLMKERKYTKQDWNVREIELCEH